MTHEGCPSLLSLDLSNPLQRENCSLRWWVIGSLVFHVLLALLAINLRFSPSLEPPVSSYEVSLVSLSALNSPTETRSESKPKDAPLTPLPTEPAREKLSDSFAGAVKSIVVPSKLSPSVSRSDESVAPVTKTGTSPEAGRSYKSHQIAL